MAASPHVLFAATLLRIPARRIRALALGDESLLRDWIANDAASRLADARRDARVALDRLEALAARVVPLGSAEYPAGLHDLVDPPAFLTVRGPLPARSRWREGTAVVGTRLPDERSARMAFALGRSVRAPIVSGLALGVDAAAHEGALASGVPTYAYVGNGIGATYPAEHADLERRIVAGGGAILSEYLPDEGVKPWSLVRRDRLQAAHAAAIVLVQSEADRGAMHALRAAEKLDRPRFAFGPRAGVGFGGNAQAIAEGAHELSWDFDPSGESLEDTIRTSEE